MVGMTGTTLQDRRTPPPRHDRPELQALGTTVAIVAHPDDEAYLAGGVLAALRDLGQRVVCVTATRGDAGNGLHEDGAEAARAMLAATRTDELARALDVLGVVEHRWLHYVDTQCAAAPVEDAVDQLKRILTEVQPRTVLSFGADGFTGHPDHRAVAQWTELAVARCRPRPQLLQAVTTQAVLDDSRDVNDAFDVFVWGYPPVVAEPELAVHLVLDGFELSRKVTALREQHSQTAELIGAIGIDRFAQWVRAESFRRKM
jgi:LmbE family N-acetylglucosaminyl deacetylase